VSIWVCDISELVPWDVLAWNMIGLMALRNVGVDCLYMLLLLPRSLNILIRNMYIMNLMYTLSTEFVLAQVRGNNHWRTSRVRLKILNDRTLGGCCFFSVLLYIFSICQKGSICSCLTSWERQTRRNYLQYLFKQKPALLRS
jgi:hypothetical protein